jgi:hypothetical protein
MGRLGRLAPRYFFILKAGRSASLRAALLAGTPWLDVFCPGCGTSKAIVLRTVDRHPLASVSTLVLGLRCSWCPGLGADAKADRPLRFAASAAGYHQLLGPDPAETKEAAN